MSIWKNISKRGLKDILNPVKWMIFIRYIRKTVKGIGDYWSAGVWENGFEEEDLISEATLAEYSELSTPHQLEQIVYRMSQPGCRECLIDGECHHCGCKSPDLFYDRTNWCSGNHWSAMLSKEDWDDFVRERGVIIDEDYLTQVVKFGKIVDFKE
jgi:hypothetical protein